MKKFSEEEIIIKENEKNDVLYKVVHGSVALYMNYGHKDEFLLGILSKGKCFGEIGFLTDAPSRYTAVANEETALLEITKENFTDFIANNPRNAIDIMKSVSNHVVLLQKHLEMVLDEYNEKEENKAESNRRLMEAIRSYKAFL